MKKILAIITARKGSKGLSNKNFRKIQGYSLTEKAVLNAMYAKEQGLIEDIYVSTDSQFLIKKCSKITSESYVERGINLSGDNIKSIDVVYDVLNIIKNKKKEYTDVLILQPTSPLLTKNELCEALNKYMQLKDTHSMISICKLHGINPNGLYFLKENVANPLLDSHNLGLRRQEIPDLYLRNGAIFIVNINYMFANNTLIAEKPSYYEMPLEHSINVDSIEEYNKAKLYSSKKNPCHTLVVEGNEENICFCKKLTNEPTGIQIVSEELFYKTWFFCRKTTQDENKVSTFWEKNIYVDGINVFCNGEDITEMVSETKKEEISNFAKNFITNKIDELNSDANVIFLTEHKTNNNGLSDIISFVETIRRNTNQLN